MYKGDVKQVLKISGIVRDSIVDGEGFRYVIFFQGCKHNCVGCQNPQTHSFDGGMEIDIESIMRDLSICNGARLMDITLSGGDPFFQAKEVIELCKELKKEEYNIWAYTGFVFESFLEAIENNIYTTINRSMIELLNYIDVLVDGPFILERKSLECAYRGSDNQRLIDVQKSLIEHKIKIYELGV